MDEDDVTLDDLGVIPKQYMNAENAETYIKRLMKEYWEKRSKEIEEAKANGTYVEPNPEDLFFF